MSPWDLYDALIAPIPADVTVTGGAVGLRWCRILTSEGGLGLAYTMPEQSRPPLLEAPTLQGRRLRDVAALAKSWNLAEAGIGMAAINAWYAEPARAKERGFAATADTWRQVFDPYGEAVAGKTVSVIGHFPFAPAALSRAGELRILERSPQPGDFPDPACEYLLPDSDYVFISSSALVNKTMPRLLALAREATTIVLGPSTPLSPVLFEHGADVVTGLVGDRAEELFESLGGLHLNGMFALGHRVVAGRP